MTITSYVYVAVLIALAGIVAAAFTRIGAAADRQTAQATKRLERGER